MYTHTCTSYPPTYISCVIYNIILLLLLCVCKCVHDAFFPIHNIVMYTFSSSSSPSCSFFYDHPPNILSVRVYRYI